MNRYYCWRYMNSKEKHNWVIQTSVSVLTLLRLYSTQIQEHLKALLVQFSKFKM